MKKATDRSCRIGPNGAAHEIYRSLLLGFVVLLASLGPIHFGGASASAAQRWPDERRVEPFVCHSTFSLDGYDDLLGDLEGLRSEVAETLGVREADEPIHLYLFARKATYEKYVKQYFPNVPNRRALFIKADGPGMVFAYRSEQFRVDLRHECTHALLHASLPMVPLWLDEGLAEYFEVAPRQRAYANPHLKTVRWNARLRIVPSMPKLEELGHVSRMGAAEYRNAWAWTHFMLHGSAEARDELTLYLSDIQQHVPPGQLSDRLPGRVPNLNARFLEHFKGWER